MKQISWFFIIFHHFVPSKLFCSVGVACVSFLQDLAQKIGKTFKAAKEAMSAVINMPPAESLWLLLFDQVPVHPTKPHLKPKRVQGWCESWVGIKICAWGRVNGLESCLGSLLRHFWTLTRDAWVVTAQVMQVVPDSKLWGNSCAPGSEGSEGTS